jgi:uncharacterized protein (DUF427 family)
MTDKPKLIPGPDHPITIEPAGVRIVVRVADTVVADSRSAKLLRESTYPPVAYIPREDVDLAALQPSDHQTYCPYKGEASYFSIPAAGERGVNAVWSYEAPYDAATEIKDYVAFYPNRVDAIEELPLIA